MQLSTLVLTLCLAVLACVGLVSALDASSVPTVYGLNQQQEAYQLGVWTFIVFLVIGLLGFGTMASIDYSDDALLTSAPDNTKMD